MEITYPRTKSEFETQAEIFYKFKELGFDVRGEVNIYRPREKWVNGKRKFKDRKTYCRPDIIIFKFKKPILIIEVKKKMKGFKKQLKMYKEFGVPVVIMKNSNINPIVKKFNKLLV